MARQMGSEGPDPIDRIWAAADDFLRRNTVNGVFVGSPDGPDFNQLPVPSRLAGQGQPNIVVKFDSIEHFENTHKAATVFENDLENKTLDNINKGNCAFKAWTLVSVPSGEDEEIWIILVQPKPDIADQMPSIGESCQLRIIDPETGKDRSAWWTVKRVNNQFGSAGGWQRSWSNLLVFNATLSQTEDEAHSVIHPLLPNDENLGQNLANLVLDNDNAVDVGLFFSNSDATFSAEMTSLGKLVRASKNPTTAAAIEPTPWPEQRPDPRQNLTMNPFAVQRKQLDAFKYLLDFNEPAFHVNVFDIYPHMKNPDQEGSGIDPTILEKYRRMNKHQRDAYDNLLSNMPCGIGILPGGPGGGKTDWALTVIGLMQSNTNAKALYLLDINDPLDDATVKYIKMIKKSGMVKHPIRMRSFGTELKKSVRIGSICQGTQITNSNEPEVDFSRRFLQLHLQQTASSGPAPGSRHHDLIPTLDEAAWDYYDANKEEFATLSTLLETGNGSALDNRALRFEIFFLYQKVLEQADFISTTPCVAATAFNKMFAPDLVVFDEAAHARELSTLIAIANFCPTVGWIMIGDHRQTQPTVKSNQENPFGRQLATSAMERAHLAGALEHQLLINHRAYSSLERLPSKLIYEGKMVSGIPFKDRFPPCSKFVRNYFENIAGARCNVPRLIVHLQQAGRPMCIGTSWYHPTHMSWTMERVWELIQAEGFRSAENTQEPGTILLLAPYKAAVAKYQEAIAEMADAHPESDIFGRVEARTWDSSQGHEADIIGIDYVRDHPTGFMDGMYRFNVGLTRARQGEWHLMHPDMPFKYSFGQTKYLRKLYGACCGGLDGLDEGRIANLHYVNGHTGGKVNNTAPWVWTNEPPVAGGIFPIVDPTIMEPAKELAGLAIINASALSPPTLESLDDSSCSDGSASAVEKSESHDEPYTPITTGSDSRAESINNHGREGNKISVNEEGNGKKHASVAICPT